VVEGSFPPFVLEVISRASAGRDRVEKKNAFELAGVREYALFTPHQTAAAKLQGYRRNDQGNFEAWRPDAEGRLWSEVLSLHLVRGRLVQAQTAEGRLLLTPEQAEAERQRAEAESARLVNGAVNHWFCGDVTITLAGRSCFSSGHGNAGE